MSRLRLAFLTLILLLGGGAMFWWFGPGQPDPVYALISRLPEPAAEIVSMAVRRTGYALTSLSMTRAGPQKADSSPSTDGSGALSELAALFGLVPSTPSGDASRYASVPDPELVPTPGHSATDPAAGNGSGLNLKLESRVTFRSLPRIKSALFSESRRLLVYFPLDRFDLTPASRVALTELSESLTEAQLLFALRIDGHCDDTGDQEYNQRLSVRRAEAVRDFLLARGLSADVTVLRGFGERIPAAVGGDDGSRARNRRAEIWVEWVESRSAEGSETLLLPSD